VLIFVSFIRLIAFDVSLRQRFTHCYDAAFYAVQVQHYFEDNIVLWSGGMIAFSALTLLVGQQEGRLACKN